MWSSHCLEPELLPGVIGIRQRDLRSQVLLPLLRHLVTSSPLSVKLSIVLLVFLIRKWYLGDGFILNTSNGRETPSGKERESGGEGGSCLVPLGPSHGRLLWSSAGDNYPGPSRRPFNKTTC